MFPPTNDELIQRAQAGDGVAIGELCLRLYPVAFSHLYRLSGHRHDAEDLAQGVIIVFLRRQPYRPASSFLDPTSGQLACWVRGVATRVYYNFRRKARNARKRALSDAEWENLATGEFGPSAEAEQEDLAARLRFLIEELPAQLRDVLVANFFKCITFREMSEETGISEGTLQGRAVKARAELLRRIVTSEPGLVLWIDTLSTTPTRVSP